MTYLRAAGVWQAPLVSATGARTVARAVLQSRRVENAAAHSPARRRSRFPRNARRASGRRRALGRVRICAGASPGTPPGRLRGAENVSLTACDPRPGLSNATKAPKSRRHHHAPRRPPCRRAIALRSRSEPLWEISPARRPSTTTRRSRLDREQAEPPSGPRRRREPGEAQGTTSGEVTPADRGATGGGLTSTLRVCRVHQQVAR